jgi:hypothetical protein
MVLSTSLIAQVAAPITQDIPLQQPKLQQELYKWMLRMQGRLLDGFKDPLLAPPKRVEATESSPSVEDRIAALEAKVAALQSEIEAQKAIIKQLQERLDQQQQSKH